jgi:hypothetical protein
MFIEVEKVQSGRVESQELGNPKRGCAKNSIGNYMTNLMFFIYFPERLEDRQEGMIIFLSGRRPS